MSFTPLSHGERIKNITGDHRYRRNFILLWHFYNKSSKLSCDYIFQNAGNLLWDQQRYIFTLFSKNMKITNHAKTNWWLKPKSVASNSQLWFLTPMMVSVNVKECYKINNNCHKLTINIKYWKKSWLMGNEKRGTVKSNDQ